MIKIITTGMFQTNTYLIFNKNNECILVDPTLDFEPYANDILNKYKVIAILLTHGHVDHIDGIRYFDCPIYCSKEEKKIIEDDTYNLYNMLGLKSHLKNDKFIYLEDNEEFIINDFKFKALLTPGHTKGSMCYLLENCLFSGDTIFYHTIGRTDFPSGNMKDMRNSVKRILELKNDIIIYPGHEEVTSIKEEKKFNPYR